MLRPPLAMLFAFSMATGCEGTSQDECEKALVVVDAFISKELAKSETEEVRRAVANMQADTNKYFVSECRKLDATGMACIPRMQEFLTKGSAVEEKHADCYTAEFELKPECAETIKKELDAVMGECGPPLDALQLGINERATPDWQARQAAKQSAQ